MIIQPLTKPEAIFFDLDDTLLEYEGVAEEAWLKTFHAFTKMAPISHLPEELHAAFLRLRSQYWSNPSAVESDKKAGLNTRCVVLSQLLHEFNILKPTYIDHLAKLYPIHRMQLIRLFPDTLFVLKELNRRGILLVMITNGKTQVQREKINRFELAQFFTSILIEEDVGFGKPDLRIYEKALDIVNCQPRDVWMVGDHPIFDVATPKSLGIPSILCDRYEMHGNDGNIDADGYVTSVQEIIALMDRLS